MEHVTASHALKNNEKSMKNIEKSMKRRRWRGPHGSRCHVKPAALTATGTCPSCSQHVQGEHPCLQGAGEPACARLADASRQPVLERRSSTEIRGELAHVPSSVGELGHGHMAAAAMWRGPRGGRPQLVRGPADPNWSWTRVHEDRLRKSIEKSMEKH